MGLFNFITSIRLDLHLNFPIKVLRSRAFTGREQKVNECMNIRMKSLCRAMQRNHLNVSPLQCAELLNDQTCDFPETRARGHI